MCIRDRFWDMLSGRERDRLFPFTANCIGDFYPEKGVTRDKKWFSRFAKLMGMKSPITSEKMSVRIEEDFHITSPCIVGSHFFHVLANHYTNGVVESPYAPGHITRRANGNAPRSHTTWAKYIEVLGACPFSRLGYLTWQLSSRIIAKTKNITKTQKSEMKFPIDFVQPDPEVLGTFNANGSGELQWADGVDFSGWDNDVCEDSILCSSLEIVSSEHFSTGSAGFIRDFPTYQVIGGQNARPFEYRNMSRTQIRNDLKSSHSLKRVLLTRVVPADWGFQFVEGVTSEAIAAHWGRIRSM